MMKYETAKNLIKKELKKHPAGLTWKELKEKANLPYKTFCPKWTLQLEEDIGLVRLKGHTRALVWKLEK